tara:strand:- start:563 stop:994 length:432 start_codon:yes stop_codon:yes gene_type:complete
MADKCPMVASENSFPDPGCPEKEATFVLNNTGGTSAGIPTALIAIIVLMLFGISGLVVAVMLKQRKPKGRGRAMKKRPRLEQALDVVDEAAEEWLDEQVADESPHWELQGAAGDDGVEWLEWPEGSDSWWQRDESGYWVEWQQ